MVGMVKAAGAAGEQCLAMPRLIWQSTLDSCDDISSLPQTKGNGQVELGTWTKVQSIYLYYIIISQCRKTPSSISIHSLICFAPSGQDHSPSAPQFQKAVPKCCRNRFSCCGIVHNDVNRSSSKVNSSGWHGVS
jgi:hypothetical protein